MVRIHFDGHRDVEIRTSRYRSNNRLAVTLYHAGEQYADVSVNCPNVPLEKDTFLVKNYGENTGLIEALIQANALESTGRTAETPVGILPVCRLPAQS